MIEPHIVYFLVSVKVNAESQDEARKRADDIVTLEYHDRQEDGQRVGIHFSLNANADPDETLRDVGMEVGVDLTGKMIWSNFDEIDNED